MAEDQSIAVQKRPIEKHPAEGIFTVVNVVG